MAKLIMNLLERLTTSVISKVEINIHEEPTRQKLIAMISSMEDEQEAKPSLDDIELWEAL